MYMAFFLSYVLLLLITISSLFVYYAQTRTSVMEKEAESQKVLIAQLEDNIDEKVKYTDNLVNGIVVSGKLQKFDVSYPYGNYSYIDLFADIQSVYRPDYLVNYSVYFSNLDEVVTTETYMKAEEYFKYMYSPVGMDYAEFAEEYLTGYHLRTLGPALTVKIAGNSESTVLPYVQTFPFSGKSMGQIIVFIDTDDISQLISQISQSTMSDVYILDENDQMMFSSDNAHTLPEERLDEITDSSEALEIQVDNQPMIVMSVSSSVNGWKYLLMTPKNIYFRESIQFALTCALIFAVYLVAGLLIGHFLAKRNSRPINEISDIIKKYVDSGEQVAGRNELRAIKSVLLDRFSSDQKLNEIVQSQKPIVKQACLLSLVKGLEVNWERSSERLKSVGVEFVSDRFMAVALEFDLDSPFFMEEAQFQGKNYSLARVIVQNIGEELFSKDFQCFFLDLDRNQSFFLLNAVGDAGPAELSENLKKNVAFMNNFVKNNFRLNVSWGLSLLHENVKDLPKCYDEAEKALESSKRTIADIVSFDSVQNIETDYFFPAEIEAQMMNLLKNGNYRECKELLQNIFQINAGSTCGISEPAKNEFLSSLMFALARIMNMVPGRKEKQPVLEQTLLNELGENPTLKSAETYCLRLIDSVAKESQNQIVSKTELLVKHITDFVDENIEGKMLDLNYISEKFGLTPQYISNIFKRYQKENIKEYISIRKLNRAKELLVSTDLSNCEISVRLGYVNELGIFRLFRKYENMTPGKYRTLHKNPEDGAKDP